MIFAIVASFVLQAQAVIESMGVKTVEDARATLEASDYKLNLDDGVMFQDREAGWKARQLDLKKSPALGGRDVQFQAADGIVTPGGRFLRHFHPRSAELVFQKAGTLEFTIEFENGETAKNVLRRGDFLVVPQGLIHVARCVSKSRCIFLAIFRTADPGLVPLPFLD